MLSAGDIAIRSAFSLVTLVGVVGNILVCLVVLLNRPMRTPMNYLLVNLAISDMLLLVFFSPTFIFKGTYTHPPGVLGDVLCSLVTGETLAWMGGYASSAILLAISIERYFAVAHPHSYGASFITRNLKILVFICWLFALFWNSVGFGWKRFDPNLKFCIITLSPQFFQVYSMLSFLILGVIPMATMAVLYTRVVYILWFRDVVVRLDEEKQRKKRRKATKMVVIVSIIYALTWFPELTVFVLLSYTPTLLRFEIAYPATVALCACNSAINPIVYSLQNNQFQHYIKKLFGFRQALDESSVISANSGNNSRLRVLSRDPRSNADDVISLNVSSLNSQVKQ